MLKKKFLWLLVSISCFLFLGNIWYWKDDKGVRHFSNVAPPKGKDFQELEERRKIYKKLNAEKNKGYLFHVVKVFDGDTIRVTGLDLKFTIRLAGIDSPEIGFKGRHGQPYCQKARQYLTDLVENRKVRIKSYGTGGYNRQLAEVFIGDRNINLEMISAGMAEVYTGRLPKGLDSKTYFNEQAAARQKRKGVWRLGVSYKSPRQWRKENPRK